MGLKDSVVLVIGASSGMGRETAMQFAREGANVMASARREERLLRLKDQLAEEGRTIEVYAADATDPAAMDRLAAATLEQFGRIEVLVYATGTNTPDRALTRLTPPVWDMMLAVNLNGAYYATQAVLPHMRQRKAGLIFYLSSRSAVMPDESGAAYQAAKRGLMGLSQAIRVEEKENGIRTCVVCPGLTDTEILEKRLVKPSAEMLAKALRAEDIAELVVAIARLPARTWVPEVHLFPADV
jgi:NADP-dependent 3-hydroxy acid dehydrogenase YdfG